MHKRTEEIYVKHFDTILGLYDAGTKPSALAKRYGVSTPTIYKWLKKAGRKISRRGSLKRLGHWRRTEAVFETHFKDIAEQYEAGRDIKDIAQDMGVSAPTVSNWLRKGGYKRRKRGRTPDAMRARAHDLYNRGWDVAAIADLFKEKISDVEQWLIYEPPPVLQERFENPGTKPTKRRRRGRKENPVPNPPHKCHTKWSDAEKAEVYTLMIEGLSVREIYYQTGASRTRQNQIFKELDPTGDVSLLPARREAEAEKRRKRSAERAERAVPPTPPPLPPSPEAVITQIVPPPPPALPPEENVKKRRKKSSKKARRRKS